MTKSAKKQKVLITGGSRGIGKATVLKFLGESYEVIATATTDSIDYEHANLTYIKADVTNNQDIKKLASNIKKIDVLINNSGIVGDYDEKQLNVSTLKNVLDVNLFGTARVSEALVSKMPKGGLVINISSAMGAFSEGIMDGWVPSYRISKAAVNMYTRTLAASVSKKGISVCSYEPGWVKTDMGGPDADREASEAANEIFELVNKGFESGAFYGPQGKREW